jgi:hypothetical protein
MNLDSSKESKIDSEERAKKSRNGLGKVRQPPSKSPGYQGVKLSFDSLMRRFWSAFAESLKLENLPLVVLLVLAAVSLISRLWLMLH